MFYSVKEWVETISSESSEGEVHYYRGETWTWQLELKKSPQLGLHQICWYFSSPKVSTLLLFTESQSAWGWKGPLWNRLAQPPCSSRVTLSTLHRITSRQVLRISRKGDSTAFLGNLFQCSFTLTDFNCNFKILISLHAPNSMLL